MPKKFSELLGCASVTNIREPDDFYEPDRRIYRIRLSDKTSRLHPQRAATKLGQAYEPEVLVKAQTPNPQVVVITFSSGSPRTKRSMFRATSRERRSIVPSVRGEQ